MPSRALARLLCTASLLVCAGSHAAPLQIDLPTALARARDHAPEAIAARGRIGEAEAERAGARVRFTQNLEVEGGAGPRFGDPRTTRADVRIAQPLEPGRRGARIRVADAGVAHALAVTDAQLRELALEVATTWSEARHADLVVELARKQHAAAARGADAAARRRRAGDATDLDVDLAKVALGRAASAVAAAQAERADAIGRLAVLIGALPDDVITLTGDLRPPPLTLAALRAALPARADVRALEAESRVARAEHSLATANARTGVGVWLGYERDEGDSIVFGGLTLTLPLWNRSQGEKAVARAKERRVAREREAVATGASRQVVDAFEAYTRAREAVEVFERDVLPPLADGEQLLDRSIDAGQVSTTTYLTARQEILGAHRDHLDRQLALAKAAAAARFIAGVTP